MRNIRYFIWILVPLALFAALQIFGAPFIRWNYSWRDDGQGHNPYAPRWYLACTYVGVGVGGSFSVGPSDGNCPLIRFEKTIERGNL